MEASQGRAVVNSEVQEILNYFGQCPICGHPARAWHITAVFDDRRVSSQDVAECGGWCGWKGPVRPVAMTDDALVLTKEHANWSSRTVPLQEFPVGRDSSAPSRAIVHASEQIPH